MTCLHDTHHDTCRLYHLAVHLSTRPLFMQIAPFFLHRSYKQFHHIHPLINLTVEQSLKYQTSSLTYRYIIHNRIVTLPSPFSIFKMNSIYLKQLNRTSPGHVLAEVLLKSRGRRFSARSADWNHGLITRRARLSQISRPNQIKPIKDVDGTPVGRLGGLIMLNHRIQAIHHIAPLYALVRSSLNVKSVGTLPGPFAIRQFLGARLVAGFSGGDLQELDGAGGGPSCASGNVDLEAVRTGSDWANS